MAGTAERAMAAKAMAAKAESVRVGAEAKVRKGGGKGVYGLDLMGSDTWGPEEDWGGDGSWGGDAWGGQTSYEGTGYLRSLAVLAEAPPIVINNSFNALDDDNTFSVPITDLMITSKRKLSSRTRHDSILAHHYVHHLYAHRHVVRHNHLQL